MTDWEILKKKKKNRSYSTITNSLRCTGINSKSLEGILFRVMLAAVIYYLPHHLAVHKIGTYFSLTEPDKVGKGPRILPCGDSTIP